ncbi:MAG: HD domain-containing phosphohydrolase [Gemmatimonadota bacterium]
MSEGAAAELTGVAASTTARAVLYHAGGPTARALETILAAEGVELRPLADVADLPERVSEPSVVLLEGVLARDFAPPLGVVAVAATEAEAAEAPGTALFTLPTDGQVALRVLRNAFTVAGSRLAAERAQAELERSRGELSQLHEIGMALMTERDPDRLLRKILSQAMGLTASDAGSLYLAEADGEGGTRLRFKLAENTSLPDLPFNEFTLPVDPSSLAGYAATTGEPLVLDDAYQPPADAPYGFNRSFDERFGYRTKSMLVVPMVDHKDDVVGVVQLINRKTDPDARITSEEAADAHVSSYDMHELQLVRSLAGQAAVSIENSRLYEQIQTLFESFVKAAVTAIDQRDPTTAGHSVRVATLTTDLAEAVQRGGSGRHRDVRFSREQMRELRYAAMLHDFGKVGVREHVLTKAKKLPPQLFERVAVRFDLIRRTTEADFWRRQAELLRSGAAMDAVHSLEEAFEAELQEIDRFREVVETANEPTVLPEEAASILGDIAERRYPRPDGVEAPFLSPEELHFLRIPRGTLDEDERKEIESHVEQTYRFLREIPWTDDLRNLADIAYGHHEKLDGRGYPRGITGEEIPVQTRMMTIADIFDALTASDRPYKRALPAERALDILTMEAKDGMLDSELVEILIQGEIYRRVLEADWREL